MAKKTGDLSDPRVKFNQKVRNRYLRVLTTTGRKYEAARAAGVCPQTVKDHQKVDPEFDSACERAMELYRDHLEGEVYRRAVEGVEEPVYQKGTRVLDILVDKNGQPVLDEEGEAQFVPAYVRKFSDRMLELHVKRHIPEYRDKATLDVNASGGVLAVPGQQSDVDWEERYGQEKVIEGEVIDEDRKHITRG